MNQKDMILVMIIISEIIAIGLLINRYYFDRSPGSYSNEYNDCVISPFTSEIVYCIDREKEEIFPKYGCNFLIFNTNGTRVLLKKSYSQLFDGCSYKLPKVTNVTINSFGFRDYEYNMSKLKDYKLVAALGSSITFGWGVELNQSWPKQLERLINKNCSEKVFVLNFGLPTANMIEKVEFFSKHSKFFKPSLILVEYNGYQDFLNYTLMSELRNNNTFVNDIMHGFEYKSEREFETELSKRIYSYEMRNSRMQLDDRFDIFFTSRMIYLHNITASPIVIIMFVGDYDDIRLLRKTVDKFDWLYFIDVKSYLSSFDQKDLVLHSLDFHPSAYAYELVSKYIYEKLIEYGLIKLVC